MILWAGRILNISKKWLVKQEYASKECEPSHDELSIVQLILMYSCTNIHLHCSATTRYSHYRVAEKTSDFCSDTQSTLPYLYFYFNSTTEQPQTTSIAGLLCRNDL